jgi:glycosyltransferase involved in cell wall biosynthesis
MAIKKKKILLLVTLSEWGGAQHIVYLLAKYFQKEYEISVACAPGGELISKLQEEDIRVIPIPEFARNPHLLKDLLMLLKLYRLTKREKFDLVHAHSTKAGLLGRLAARLAGVKAILFTAHGWAFTEGRNFWKRWVLAQTEKIASACSMKIACVSEHDRQLALKFGVTKTEKLLVIHNGLEEEPFLQAQGAGVARELNLTKEKETVITFVGRLAAPKEPVVLLESLKKFPHAKALLVGDGPMRPELEAYIAQNQLSERASILGMRSDIPEILAASDIFVLPSRWEGLPLVIIEAMFAGLPIIATDVGGVSELVQEKINGFLIPRSDVAALQRALAQLIADKTLREEMGEKSRQRALKQFTMERMLAQYEKLYRETLQT